VVAHQLSPPGSWYRSILPQAFTTGELRRGAGPRNDRQQHPQQPALLLLAVMFNMVLGIAIAFVVVRSTIRLRGTLDGLSMLPLAVPGLVMAFGYLAISSI
jgi:iron(III) transport system permease protein